ncbi:MAG: GNAT family N-acetyltransferase [Rubellimicrobium sp.]|nr:GNAT family N-acetyltransferase [Rubellimicrobium sp.]
MTPANTAEALAALHARASGHERSWSAAEFVTLLATPGTVLDADGASFLLGRIVLDEAEVLMIATDPDHRRQGRARARLAGFERLAGNSGAKRVVLEVAEDNAPARALYGVAGYRQVGARPGYYHRKGRAAVTALVLARDLRRD